MEILQILLGGCFGERHKIFILLQPLPVQVVLMIDGVELDLLDQVQQMWKLKGQHAFRLQNVLEAGHEVDLNELPFEAFIKADEATVEDGLVSIADADFERVTGWTAGDAIEMAAECRRDDRLFKGGRRLH